MKDFEINAKPYRRKNKSKDYFKSGGEVSVEKPGYTTRDGLTDKCPMLPKKIFYHFAKECKFPHSVGYKTDSGYRILFSMNYNTEWHKTIAEEIVKLWNIGDGK